MAHFAQALPDFAHALMQAFWPGPLTLILPRRPGVAAAAAGGQNSISLRCQSPSSLRLLKKESSMTCCDWLRMDSRAPISRGSGSLRERVKALGNSKCRASAAKAGEWIRSVSWEKRLPRVNPIFCCHGDIALLRKFVRNFQKNQLNHIVTGIILTPPSNLKLPFLKFGGFGPG